MIPSQGTGDDGDVVGQYYDDAVNTSMTNTASLAYDPTHWLTGAVATGNSTYNLAFAYDRYGNMTCQTNGQTQGPCPNYSFNANTNQISTSGFSYDASGNLTNDGTHSYQYDAEGRLISVDNGTTASYVYNALAERVEKDVGGTYTEYVFGREGNPLGENNRTSWVDAWVDFQGMHIAHFIGGVTYFAHADRVGTTFMITDQNGNVVQDELHYPWGQEWTMAGTLEEERFAKLQHRDSATSLDPTHFRMYAPGVGRWMTPDPLYRGSPINPQSLNRYGYALGSPTTFTDPTGLDTVSCGPGVLCTTVLGEESWCQMSDPMCQVQWNMLMGLGPAGEIPRCGGFNGCDSFYGGIGGGGGGGTTVQPPPNINVRRTAPPSPPPLQKLKQWGVRYFCGRSPAGAALNWMETGATKGALTGAVAGFAAGGVFTGGPGGIPGALLGAFGGGVVGATGGVLWGSAAAGVCYAAGVYGH